MPGRWSVRGAAILLIAWAGSVSAQMVAEPASPRSDIRFYKVAWGFAPEATDANGVPKGTGFALPNRWGQYTAYIMMTDAKGERTWRIEHCLPVPGTDTAQGSTMYLVEGQSRAVLIDTANRAAFTPGVNDLKTVVRFLLGHENDGRIKAHPLDFVVANTHDHADHIGENMLMSDRTVYYMDGDWPVDAPANYVPIREGGGATAHGKGVAIGGIDLGGGRVLKALAMPPHTPGSTGYLDVGNQILFSGDAMGSAWPWLQWASIRTYARTLHHIEQVTRTYPDLIVLPAHFYQIRAYGRSGPPLDGRPLDRRYITDQMALADELIAGTIDGEPYPWHHDAAWAALGTARLVYSLDHLADPGDRLPSAYHAMRLPGSYRREWTATESASVQDIDRLSDITADVHIIRQADGPSLFLIRGSASALLIGTGSGAPGLAGFVRRLIGSLPLDVALLDTSREQASGLTQLLPRRIYGPTGTRGTSSLRDGQRISLGRDRAGRPLLIEAQTLHGGAQAGLTLRDVNDRLMFAGAATLGRRSDPRDVRADDIVPFRIADPISYQVALADWSSRTVGRYDVMYLSGSADWYLSPDYVSQLQQALSTANLGKGAAVLSFGGEGDRIYRSTGEKSVDALIELTPL
jgi:glyoxylase-like metal-dependent hydrolase (beta-lactamase superfamily II)